MCIEACLKSFRGAMVVWDLDNTLYDEKEFLYSAFALYAKKMSLTYSYNAINIFDSFVETFKQNGHCNLFDKSTDFFPELHNTLEDFLTILRCSKPLRTLRVHPRSLDLLFHFKNLGLLQAILTNGNPHQQMNKIHNLDIDVVSMGIEVVCAQCIESKPSPKAMKFLLVKECIKANNVIFIGDSESDFQCAAQSGVNFLKTPHDWFDSNVSYNYFKSYLH